MQKEFLRACPLPIHSLTPEQGRPAGPVAARATGTPIPRQSSPPPASRPEEIVEREAKQAGERAEEVWEALKPLVPPGATLGRPSSNTADVLVVASISATAAASCLVVVVFFESPKQQMDPGSVSFSV